MAKKQPQKEFNFPLTNIKVIGVGGAGNNSVSRMSQNFPRGVEFIAINTDHQDLDYCEVKKKIYIGRNLTRGLGTGMNPDLGRQAAEENRSEIAEAVKGADIVFVRPSLRRPRSRQALLRSRLLPNPLRSKALIVKELPRKASKR
jgi:cell division GTPase FtsZ